MAILQATDDNFEALIQSEEPVLVDFFATWCGPCKALSPILEEVAAETGATIVKVDVDECDFVMELGIMSVPTLMVFRKGELLETAVGLQSKEKILTMLHA